MALESGDTTLSGGGIVVDLAAPGDDQDGGRGGGNPGGLLMTGARGRVRVSGNYTEAAVAAVAAATAATVTPPPPPPASQGDVQAYGTPPKVTCVVFCIPVGGCLRVIGD